MIAFFRWGHLGTPRFFNAYFFAAEIAIFLSLRSSERLFYIDALDCLGRLGTLFPAETSFWGHLFPLCTRNVEHPVKLHRHLFSLIVHGVTVLFIFHIFQGIQDALTGSGFLFRQTIPPGYNLPAQLEIREAACYTVWQAMVRQY